MISQQELTNWRIQTDFLILETELHDAKYRVKKGNHKCTKNWISYGNGKWFCEHLVAARTRNKELKKKWLENLYDSPTLKHFQSLSKIADCFYSFPSRN